MVVVWYSYLSVSLPIKAVDLDRLEIKQYPSLGVRTKNGKYASTYLNNIPELLSVVRDWDNEVRKVLPGDGLWFAPLMPDTGEIDPSARVDKIGDNRYRIARRDLQDWINRVGLPYYSPHKFRHGYAVYSLKLAKDVGDLKAISQNLMHSNLQTTDGIYSILSKDDTRERILGLSNKHNHVDMGDISAEDLELALQIIATIKNRS